MNDKNKCETPCQLRDSKKHKKASTESRQCLVKITLATINLFFFVVFSSILILLVFLNTKIVLFDEKAKRYQKNQAKRKEERCRRRRRTHEGRHKKIYFDKILNSFSLSSIFWLFMCKNILKIQWNWWRTAMFACQQKRNSFSEKLRRNKIFLESSAWSCCGRLIRTENIAKLCLVTIIIRTRSFSFFHLNTLIPIS